MTAERPSSRGGRAAQLVALLIAAALAWALGGRRGPASVPSTAPAGGPSVAAGRAAPATASPAPSLPGAGGATHGVLEDVRVVNFGQEIFRGPIDLRPTLERIRAGRRLHFKDDGIEFGNREGRLPARPPGYYHEHVHPTDGLDGPGPQRVVVGERGEVFYTADHYRTFTRVE